MTINVNLDVVMAMRRIPVGELADRVGITPANLSILKNDKAKAVRFSTLDALCRELDCQPGDILRYTPDDPSEELVTDRHGLMPGGKDDPASEPTLPGPFVTPAPRQPHEEEAHV